MLFRFFQNIGKPGKPNLKFLCGKRGSLKATVSFCWWRQKQNQRSRSDYIQCGCFYWKQRCKKTDFLTARSKAVKRKEKHFLSPKSETSLCFYIRGPGVRWRACIAMHYNSLSIFYFFLFSEPSIQGRGLKYLQPSL